MRLIAAAAAAANHVARTTDPVPWAAAAGQALRVLVDLAAVVVVVGRADLRDLAATRELLGSNNH